MSKSFLIGIFSRSRARLVCPAIAAFLAASIQVSGGASAQTAGAATAADESKSAAPAAPQYPLAVAARDAVVYVVDLDLPGVLQLQQGKHEVFVRGSSHYREALNRPRSIALHPDGGVIVGDSASCRLYHIASAGAEPQLLSDARVGIPMALAVSPDGKSVYIGDAERRAILQIPIDGGEAAEVVRVNARGLAFDDQGLLWAVTPGDAAVVRVDVEAKEATPIVTGRPYSYPNGITWADGTGYVTDGYGMALWTFASDGATDRWHQGEPLGGPVGITAAAGSLYVADPKSQQVYRVNPQSKQFEPLVE